MKNKENQIEEMGEYIAEVSHLECGIKCCEECKWCGSANLQKADCTDYLIAEKLIEKGYRKASEVAREIFEEIDKILYLYYFAPDYTVGNMIYDLNELKKKYTEEGK